ncbi:MAG: Re/Si-specific NAD(P)(+) transhydrogenase subunit alpha, partial [Bacteroidia bacterium]|nr:Re/Si-specific NAD(P)(+) transhydrogenase subunit alpha [Bacteroidia bacterium]
MKIGVLKESREGENRVALTPSVVQSLQKAGFEVMIEAGSGLNSSYSDESYEKAGARIQASKANLLSEADLVIKVNTPTDSEISGLKEGSSLISFIYGVMNPGMVQALNNRKVSVFAMDAIPRISRAQNMDALSSQSNLAGYKAVIMGANAMGKIFPLMMTAAGTITPSRVVIFGAGVAGLQAIATAKRLGAIVEVTDVRPETKEQVESLGGKFIEVKSDDTVKVEGGYAKEVSAEYLQKQKEAVNKSLFQADLVITTALVMGKKAPVLITEEQVKQMKLGAVIVDMAIEQGGNCEASELGKTVVKHGVKIIGQANLPSTLANNA